MRDRRGERGVIPTGREELAPSQHIFHFSSFASRRLQIGRVVRREGCRRGAPQNPARACPPPRLGSDLFDATRIMSAVTVANLAPAVGRAAVARRASPPGRRDPPRSSGPRLRRAPRWSPRRPRLRDDRARPRSHLRSSRSPIARIAAGVDAPAAAPERVRRPRRVPIHRRASLERPQGGRVRRAPSSSPRRRRRRRRRSLRTLRRTPAAAASAPPPADPWATRRRRRRPGAGAGAARVGDGAGAASQPRATPRRSCSVSACPPSSSCPASATATGTARWAPGT